MTTYFTILGACLIVNGIHILITGEPFMISIG